MRTVAVVQARMSSVRFPGKMMHSIAGKPLLQYVIERLQWSESVSKTVVATSSESTDDPIAGYCEDHEVDCIRGSLTNVAQRFLDVFDAFPAECYVRITGDSPMVDASIVDRIVDVFESEAPDLASNVFPRSFPVGQSIEVFGAGTYRKAYESFADAGDFEHATRYFHANAGRFRIVNVTADGNYASRDLSIDRPEQADRFERMLALMDKPHWFYGWKELLALQEKAAVVPV